MHHIKPKILKPDGKQRSGRGFSPEELKKAGIDSAEAKRLKLPVDRRRKTAHDQNVEAIKAYAEKKKAETKPKPKPKPKPQPKKKAKKQKPP
jgi:ribosomal protein L13E